MKPIPDRFRDENVFLFIPKWSPNDPGMSPGKFGKKIENVGKCLKKKVKPTPNGPK